MKRRTSLRSQLVLIGLAAALVPLLALVAVVFGVEEDETIESSDGPAVVVSESGVSPWVPVAAILLGVVAIVAVWWWAKRAVDPIERMTSLTDEIQAGSLDQRLELDGAPDEIRRLGDSFDRMLDRLAASSALERRLLEDASHELRTPLAALAARLELADRQVELGVGTPDLGPCRDEVERLQATLDRLLESARSRQSEAQQVDNDVAVIVRRVVERQRLVTPEVHISVDAPAIVLLGIEGASIERAVSNLLANASQHGRGAPISVVVRDHDDRVEIVVTDEGPGISADRRDALLDRYTGDGHGLGLALVHQVAEVYGRLLVESPVADGHGARFTFELRRHPAVHRRAHR
jgi:signal transduction histidine kinase